MRGFRRVVDFCGIRRTPFQGFKFTCDNHQEELTNVKLGLDEDFLDEEG